MLKEIKERRIENIEELLDYCDLLSYDEEDNKFLIEEITESYNKDLNEFLMKIYNYTMVTYSFRDKPEPNQYALGKTLETILCWGHKLSEINKEVLKKYLVEFTLCENSYGGCNWEASHGSRWESSYYDDYMHFNFFDILVDLDSFGVDENILAECLTNEKEKGYVYILMSKNKVTNQKLRDSVYGVIDDKELYNLLEVEI